MKKRNRPKLYSTQNYPDPFNPSTTIPFTLENGGYVNLTVYNITGQKIRTLIENYLSSGLHNVVWDGCDDSGNNVGAGIYLYQLKYDDIVLSKKMLLLDNAGTDVVKSAFALDFRRNTKAKNALQSAYLTYRVTITKDGIIPFMKSGVEFVEGKRYDYIVPREDDSIQITLLKEKDEPLAAVIWSSNGETLGFLAEKPGAGIIERISGAVYMAEDGSTLTIWYGDDGLPSFAESEGWIIKFSNYTDSAVDVSFSSAADTVHVEGVKVDSKSLEELQSIITTGVFGKTASSDLYNKPAQWLFNDYVAGAIKGASLGAKIVGCATAIGATTGSAGLITAITIPVAELSCGSMFSALLNSGRGQRTATGLWKDREDGRNWRDSSNVV